MSSRTLTETGPFSIDNAYLGRIHIKANNHCVFSFIALVDPFHASKFTDKNKYAIVMF